MLYLLESAKRSDDLKKRRQGMQIRNFRMVSRDIDFIRHFRLSEDLINILEDDLKPYLKIVRRSGSLTNRQKILCALSYLGNGLYQKPIGKSIDTFMSQPSVSRAIHQVVDALNQPDVIKKYVRFPQNSDERQDLKRKKPHRFTFVMLYSFVQLPDVTVRLRKLAKHKFKTTCRPDKNNNFYYSNMARTIYLMVKESEKILEPYNFFRFYEKFNIPGVLGCIDGTLVAMIRPRQHEERYYCRKGYHARNVLIISDADLNILHVDATFGGATHDSFVFSNSVIKQHLEQFCDIGETVYLLGDSGYAQRPYLMTPVNTPNPGPPEEHYNNLHCTARNSVERTIGIWKGRFRCLLIHNVLQYDPTTASKIVVACSILHNMCNRAGIPAPTLEPEEWEEEQQLQRMLRLPHPSQDSLASGRIHRERLINL